MGGNREHIYVVQVRWSGNIGKGTAAYGAYSRAHEISAVGKAPINCSADPEFRGEATLYNPEELLVGSLSGCHMLWYLHLCAEAGVVVVDYEDNPVGEMEEAATGEGQFRKVVLKPVVRIAPGSDPNAARELHRHAHAMCFIARSVNFPVLCEPVIEVDAVITA